MTSPSKQQRRPVLLPTSAKVANNFLQNGGLNHEMKARLFLMVACLWPLCLLALFGASSSTSSPSTNVHEPSSSSSSASTTSNLKLSNILDRVDIMGYGPTHPRIAVLIVGEEKSQVLDTVKSVYQNTDLNRIFLILTIMDGLSEDPKFVSDLQKIDSGSVPHWHGLRPDIHIINDNDEEDANKNNNNNDNQTQQQQDHHGRKIHVMFNSIKQGISSSRQDGVEFISILEKKHLEAGLKSSTEDLILLLIEPGAQLVDRKWLNVVTQALIVPPPLLSSQHDSNHLIAMKLANAVSFKVVDDSNYNSNNANNGGENHYAAGGIGVGGGDKNFGKRTSFNTKFGQITTDATTDDINLSNGQSYPTPAMDGTAIALRLETYNNLPAHDLSLEETWPTNLDLSFNLWLCGDGIDIFVDAEILPPYESKVGGIGGGNNGDGSSNDNVMPMEPDLMARFAAVWMDDDIASKFLQAYSTKITRLDWETKMMHSKQSPSFPWSMTKKCRSFEWYIKEIVNTDLITEQVLDKQIAWHEQRNQFNMKVSNKLEANKHSLEVKKKQENNNNIVDNEKKKNNQLDVQKASSEMEEGPPQQQHDAGDEENNGIPNLAQNHKQKPKMPLRPTNLEIVQKAKPVDISYVDVTDGYKEFPHMGAKDANGNPGYVHDEKFLLKNPPKFTIDESKQQRMCTNHDNHYKMMIERVFVDEEYNTKQNDAKVKRDKIFCLVYTTEGGHNRIPNILETWGPKCDGFMVGSNKTDPIIGAVNIPHEGPEEYNNIWQKVRSMWSYIYDNYYEEYDWFHIGGDDLFLMPENLKYYLESEEIKTAANGGTYLPDGTETMQTPLLLGRRFAYMGDQNDIFDSGGSGYTMNKAGLKALVVDAFPNYFPHAHTFSEDTMVAKLFRKMNVLPYDTKDDDGGERYMPFMPGHHYGYRLPKDPMNSKDWYAKYSIDIKEGPAHCSPRSVAFHYVKGDDMKRLFLLAYRLCPKEYMKN